MSVSEACPVVARESWRRREKNGVSLVVHDQVIVGGEEEKPNLGYRKAISRQQPELPRVSSDPGTYSMVTLYKVP
jgi:hypothetical protein